MIVFTVFNSVVLIILVLNSVAQPGEAFEFVYSFGWCWLFSEWLTMDSSRLKIDNEPHCGISRFVFIGIILPCHLIGTRGLKGLLLLLGFTSLYIAPGVIAWGLRWILYWRAIGVL